MKPYYVLFALLIALISGVVQASPNDEAKDIISNYRFMNGDWYVVNRSLNPDLSLNEQYFYVKMRIDGDGIIQKNVWYRLDDQSELELENLPSLKYFKRFSDFFGVLFNTYNPELKTTEINYFSADSSSWSKSERVYTYSDGVIETTGNDQDNFGPFQYIERTERISDNYHRFVSKRLYESLGFWITVDSYHAYRIHRKNTKG